MWTTAAVYAVSYMAMLLNLLHSHLLKGICFTPEICRSVSENTSLQLQILKSVESGPQKNLICLSAPGIWGLAVILSALGENLDLCQLSPCPGQCPNGSLHHTWVPGMFNIPELPVLVFLSVKNT